MTQMHKNRARKGFTMAELLMVIALIAILSGVAMPNIVSARQSLSMMELDDTAKEIFVAAQNNLTARQATGTLDNPAGTTEDDTIYWLASEGGDYLLPMGAIEEGSAGRHYMICYNAKTASVIEVYCSHTSLNTLANAIQFGSYRGSANAEARKEKGIGYYNGEATGGGSVDPSEGGGEVVEKPKVINLAYPSIVIDNSNELRVNITVPNPDVYLETYKVTLSVTVEGLASDKSITFDNLFIDPITGKASCLLDSLEGEHFKDLCPGLTPGENIKVTAHLTAPSSGNTSYLPSQASAITNSLFASRKDDVLSITYARHLQNLTREVSGVTGMVRAVQNADIDWSGVTDKNFTAIKSPDLTSYTLTSYSGNKRTITGLTGSDGLFSSFRGGTVTDIYLVDPNISGRGTLGVLISSATDMTIKGCRVYALNDGSYGNVGLHGSDVTGGLIGVANHTSISDSFVGLPSITADGTTAGGLVGRLENASSIRLSYAAVDSLSGSASQAGMLVGASDTTSTIVNCYSLGTTGLSSATTFCGLVTGDASVSDSYAAIAYENGLTPSYGVAKNCGSGCAYLSATPTNSNSAVQKTYEELATEWKPNVTYWYDATPSYPFDKSLTEGYPFPAIKPDVLTLPHYGSWPVKKDDASGIKLFDDKSNEIKVILLPERENYTFTARVVDENGDFVKEKMAVTWGKWTGGANPDSSYNTSTGITSVTIYNANGKNSYKTMDFTIGDYTLRVLVIVYKNLNVTLNSSTSTTLSPGDSTSFKGSVSVVPSKAEILQKLRSISTDDVVMATTASDFDNWDKVSFTIDGDALAESTSDNNTFTAVATATGSATVSAHWAMDTTADSATIKVTVQ